MENGRLILCMLATAHAGRRFPLPTSDRSIGETEMRKAWKIKGEGGRDIRYGNDWHVAQSMRLRNGKVFDLLCRDAVLPWSL